MGAVVELQPENSFRYRDFLKIESIVRCSGTISGIVLTGQIYRRSVSLPVPNRRLNEVVLIELYHQVDLNSPLILQQQKIPMSKLALHDGAPVLRQLILSNDAYPCHSDTADARSGRLCCRLVVTSTTRGRRRKPVGSTIRYVWDFEADVGFDNSIPSHRHVYIDPSRIRGHAQVEVGSGCCGGGGDCKGFMMIPGVVLKYAWDMSLDACRTTRLNNPESPIYCYSSEQALQSIEHLVDVLHISFPCQPYSPMKADRATQHDESRTAVLLSAGAHVCKAKPLVFTMENPFGLLHDRHIPYLKRVVADLVEAGYNVQWRYVQLLDYGLAASRQRVILIASHKTIPIPTFAQPTNGPSGSGLLPYRTIWDALGSIPDNASLHLETAVKCSPPKAP